MPRILGTEFAKVKQENQTLQRKTEELMQRVQTRDNNMAKRSKFEEECKQLKTTLKTKAETYEVLAFIQMGTPYMDVLILPALIPNRIALLFKSQAFPSLSRCRLAWPSCPGRAFLGTAPDSSSCVMSDT